METFTVTHNSGFFNVVATAEDGRRKIVATYTSERAAIELMERLQARAALIDPHSVGPTDMSTKGSAAHPQGGRVLVLLPGHASGKLRRWLGQFHTDPDPGDGVAAVLMNAGAARLVRRYELPQGRRYALLGPPGP